MTGLHLLRPGASRFSDVATPSLGDHPLDTILVVADDPKRLDAFAAAVSIARRHPWLPLAIGVEPPSGGDNPYDILCEGIDVAFWSVDGGSPREVPRVRSAVRVRPAPTAERFADHLARRIAPALRQPLCDILHSSAITRRTASMLRSHGPWGAPHWRALFGMVELFADAGSSRWPLKVLVGRRYLVPKTVWQWSQTQFGVTWLGLREWCGWEAITELALRRAGYCSGSE